MAEQKNNHTIYVSKKGIRLTDGFHLVQNPKTQKVNVISISKGVVYLHDITRKMNLNDLVAMDSSNQLDVFGSLELINKLAKEK